MNFWSVTLSLSKGFSQSCIIFGLTLALALPLGLLVCFGSMSKFAPLKWLMRTLIWVERGTPLMLQIIIVFYGPGLLFGMPFKSRLVAVIIAFVLNYSCYFSEIYRGGIESITKGQYEAGQVLGMKKSKIFTNIILFQVIRRITAPMSNEVITLVKDTSLANIISVPELIFVSQLAVNKYVALCPLFYAGAFYLIFNGILTIVFGYIERKINYYKV